MASKRCMNAKCGNTEPGGEWKQGWGLKSGAFATLCEKCGMAYEQLVFCDMFHQKETGWRNCNICGKYLHCGCVVSKFSFDLLDNGGVQCISCMKNSENRPAQISSDIIKDLLPQPPVMVLSSSTLSSRDEKANDFGMSAAVNAYKQPISTDGKMDNDTICKGKDMWMGKNIESNGESRLVFAQQDRINESFRHIKQEQVAFHVGEVGNTSFTYSNQAALGPSQISKQVDYKDAMSDSGVYESLAEACPSISLGTSNPAGITACFNSKNPPGLLSLSNSSTEGKEQNKVLSTFQQEQRTCHLVPKIPKVSHGPNSEASKDILSRMRVARPPGEGRIRNQLLPRYWPRITDQELQQISGDSNSTIVPLFEKVLSASDAGRIGRLVLPKACAEVAEEIITCAHDGNFFVSCGMSMLAYFPPISQPEGLPLKIQDVKGKDWVFQFRYWPNNNSRMYVLEGVTPCIQSMQLQAGDTVTFSRIDPGGKLVMGYRKATNSVPLQESQISAFASGAISNETFFSGVIENLPISLLALERRRSRNIGSKSKRLLMDNEDALDLKLTWEEAQDLLRPPPSVEPSIVMIEDHEFEEYEDPPVFGKRTIFTARSSGEQDQWVQCDSCFKWRRLPTDVLLPSKWTCSDNTWDLKRSSCIMPDELSPNELLILLQQNSDNKRQKIGGCAKQSLLEQVASSLDSMPTAVAVADDRNQVIPSVATTTRHPRHRPGCTCIVCIQPPSGKGQKHKPACVCNVCLTVKRRFTTLMMRKKKRQSEQEETESQKKLLCDNKEGIEADSSLKRVQPIDTIHESEFENRCGKILIEKLDTNKGQIDLNYRPGREEQKQAGLARVSMMSLLQEANRPLETYLKQNGLTSLANEQRVGSTIEALPQAVGESEGRAPEVSHIASAVQELGDTGGDEGHCKAGNIESNAV